MNEILSKILIDEVGALSPIDRIELLHGDASYRTYSRITLTDGSTFIVMKMPEGKTSASEEITNFSGSCDELPFINVCNYLTGIGIPVPRVHFLDRSRGIMILEDLGDEMMFNLLGDAGDSAVLELYKQAVSLLADLQERSAAGTANECIAFARSFDAELLDWEFDHFIEYGIEARIGKSMSESDLEVFHRESRAITEQIESMPYVFTHRDFQSKNILVRDDGLHLIDFQDALMGPAVYDLVALLRDSYYELPQKMLEELVNFYAEKTGRNPEDVWMDFDLVTVQRKLKDAGRFIYIDRVKGNSWFLQHIPRSLDYVRDALKRLPEHRALLDALANYIPEWK
jgi:N-acetylmuramate 1-kinase